jgi:GNAT superfamily N-acetyltransferase
VAEIAVRIAEAGDAEAIASIHSSAWRAAFTFLPAPFLEAMSPSAVVGKWEGSLRDSTTSMVVATSDDVVAFLQLRADGDDGEVMALYVDPARWDEGIGSTLLAFGEAWLVSQGVGSALLWTARDSQQARSFYERRGWVASGDEQTQLVGPTGVALHEVEYRKALRQPPPSGRGATWP